MKLCNLILLCYYISTTHIDASPRLEDLRLDLIQVLFRHGARTPIELGKNMCKLADTSAYEPYGFGELTNGGKDQQYKFGLFLRYKYNDYLGAIYKSEDVYAYASDMSRTRMSLEYLLDGLYPPVGPAVWNPHLKWSRIPYLYTPNNLDAFLRSYKNPKYLRLLLQMLKSHKFTKIINDHSDFLKFIKDKEMVKNCNSSFIATGLTYDALVANEHMKLPMPEWYTPEVSKKLHEIVEMAWDIFIGTDEMKRLGAGSLIKTFIENLNLNGKNEIQKKIYLYAGHDVNLCLFTRAHDIQEFRVPPFGSALILEKFQDPKNQTYLRLLAWNGIDKLQTLKLGNHTEFCPIEDYLQMIEPMLPSKKEVNELLDEIIDDKSDMQIKILLLNIIKSLHL